MMALSLSRNTTDDAMQQTLKKRLVYGWGMKSSQQTKKKSIIKMGGSKKYKITNRFLMNIFLIVPCPWC